MQIEALQLSKYIKTISTAQKSLYLIHGGELAQTIESTSIIKKNFINFGFNETTIIDLNEDKTIEDFLHEINTLSVFANKRIIELRLKGNINKKDKEIFFQAIENIPEDLIIIIIANKLTANEKKSSWFLNCCNNGLVINASPIPFYQMSNWIKHKLNYLKISISNDALNLLVYYYEGNLVALTNAISKINLSYSNNDINNIKSNNNGNDNDINNNIVNKHNQSQIPKELTINDIKQYIDDNARFKNFDLIDPLLDGDAKRSMHILKCLKEQKYDPILVLWAICNEVRILIKISEEMANGAILSALLNKFGVWNYRIPKVKAALKRLDLNKLKVILQNGVISDIIVKGVISEDPWNALKTICLSFLGLDNSLLKSIKYSELLN